MVSDEISNALVVDDRLTTSGQPTEDQLRRAAAEGFDTVVNLAPHDSDNALPDEAGLVHALGMTYYNLPVVFTDPTADDFAAFEKVMAELSPDSRALIHCAANFRVSAFYSLFAMKHLGWSAERASTFRAQIWNGSDYPIWEAFISQIQRQVTATVGRG
jgi:uncharacterized protein (TIGR01244 family)